MKRLFSLLSLLALLLTPLATRVQAANTFGQIAGTFPFAPSKVLSDPVRNQVYVAVPADNTIRILFTTNLSPGVIIHLPVGSIPVDMAISTDHSKLYVANSGSTDHAVSVVDLTLDAAQLAVTTPGSIKLPGPGLGVATAPNGIIYVLSIVKVIEVDMNGNSTVVTTTPIFQFDTTNPTAPPVTIGVMNGEDKISHTLIQTSPDGSTLLVASSIGLEQFDTASGMRIALDPDLGAAAVQLIVSNTGKYLCAPDPGGNGVGSPLTTLLYNAEDVTAFYGTLSDPATPGPLAFPRYDLFVYQIRFGDAGPEVLDFDTTTFLKVESAVLPTNGLTLAVNGRNTIALDNTGSLLFVGASTSFDINSPGQLLVISTGRGVINPFQPPTVTTTTLPDGAVARPYTAPAITATLFPTGFDAIGLPPGYTINPTTGVISGTTFQAGTYDVILTASNQYGTSDPVVVTLTVTGTTILPPVITSATTASVRVDTSFAYRITAANGPTSFDAVGLPTGLTVDMTTGLISGTPTTTGSFIITLSASNVAGTGTASLELTVNPVPSPVITSSTVAAATVGTSFSYQITATNSPFSFGASGLPAGLNVNTFTGVIFGTTSTAGTFTVLLSASNSGGTGTAILTLTVAAVPAPVISSPTTDSGAVGAPFDYQIVASNNPTSYQVSGLPPGLAIDTTDGLISGTPLAAGTFSVTLTATNVSATASATLTLTIASNVPVVEIMATVPTVTTGTSDHAAVTFSRTGDLTQPLIVAYSIKGSAQNGVDYEMLSGKTKIKPNHASRTIQIIPKGSGSSEVKVIKLVILPAVSYQIGTEIRAKVKILPND